MLPTTKLSIDKLYWNIDQVLPNIYHAILSALKVNSSLMVLSGVTQKEPFIEDLF